MWITSGSLVQTCQWLPHSSSCMSDVHGNMDRWTRSQVSAHSHLTPSMCRGNQLEKGRGRGIVQSLNIVYPAKGNAACEGTTDSQWDEDSDIGSSLKKKKIKLARKLHRAQDLVWDKLESLCGAEEMKLCVMWWWETSEITTLLANLLLVWQQFKAQLECSTGFTGELAGLFGFQKQGGCHCFKKKCIRIIRAGRLKVVKVLVWAYKALAFPISLEMKCVKLSLHFLHTIKCPKHF